MSFGTNLKIIMALRGKTSAELAEKVNLTRGGLSFILTNKVQKPRQDTVQALARELGVSPTDFFRDDLVNLTPPDAE